MRLILDRFLNVGSCVKYPTRAFCSVQECVGGGFLHGIIREFDARDSGGKTNLRRLVWHGDGRLFQDDLLVSGEDPRLFMWNNRPMVMFVSWHGGPDWCLWLWDIARGTDNLIELTIDGYKGKNWVPVVSKGELYVVRSLDPICILSVDVQTGVCRTYVGSLSRSIGTLRGGGNALTHDDGTLYGFGHQTLSPAVHRVFAYDLRETDPDKQIIFPDPPSELADAGIIDPTSHWIDAKGNEFIAVCASERDWNHYQLFRHAILRVER